jgi:beta-aspartyl-peptidase (threonine type)
MTEPPRRWAVILHGGARRIEPEREAANRRGCLAALGAGQAILERGGSALDAAEAALRALEADPTFNAGFGSVLNAAGEVEMDAALMDGSTLAVGGVAALQGVRHPVSVARLLLEETPTLLVAEGARRFARDRGAELCDPQALISPEQLAAEAHDPRMSGHDTVGCVVLDGRGHLAAGTSTGGLGGALPGRVGDSPLPGCGLYADDALGGVALSGHGEGISRLILAARVMQGLEGTDVQTAVDAAVARMPRVGGDAGAVALDARGRVGWAHNSPQFAVAYATQGQPARVSLHKGEEPA